MLTSPTRVAESASQALRPSSIALFSIPLAERCIRSRVDRTWTGTQMQCWHRKLWLHLLYHNISPFPYILKIKHTDFYCMSNFFFANNLEQLVTEEFQKLTFKGSRHKNFQTPQTKSVRSRIFLKNRALSFLRNF